MKVEREHELGVSCCMQSANKILDDSFLEIRAKLLEVAATLDRLDRSCEEHAPLTTEAQSRRAKLDEAIRILLSEGPDRAERVQKLFSREYRTDWRVELGL
jgi:hypothetical protein